MYIIVLVLLSFSMITNAHDYKVAVSKVHAPTLKTTCKHNCNDCPNAMRKEAEESIKKYFDRVKTICRESSEQACQKEKEKLQILKKMIDAQYNEIMNLTASEEQL